MARSFSVVQQESISDEVFAVLRHAIVDGALSAGTRLVESQIANEMGISRAPVREALRRLQQEGLIVNQPRRGKFVTEITMPDIEHLYIVRAALEEAAIRAIIAQDPDGVIEELEQIVAALAEAAEREDLAQVVDFEFGFHEAICERSGNRYLAGAFHSISAQIRMGLFIDNSRYANLAQIAEDHEPLIEVIRRRDASAIREVVHKHTWNIA